MIGFEQGYRILLTIFNKIYRTFARSSARIDAIVEFGSSN